MRAALDFRVMLGSYAEGDDSGWWCLGLGGDAVGCVSLVFV